MYQSLASVRLSQQRPQEAAECMARSVALWLPEERPARMAEDADDGADADGAGGEGGEEEEEEDYDTSKMPPFDARVSALKLLLEVGHYETALRVVDTLVQSQDRPGAHRCMVVGDHTWLTREPRNVCAGCPRWRTMTRSCRSGTSVAGRTTSWTTTTLRASRWSTPWRCARRGVIGGAETLLTWAGLGSVVSLQLARKTGFDDAGILEHIQELLDGRADSGAMES